MRASPLLIGAASFCLTCFVASTFVSPSAFAQSRTISDADRKAARDLYFQGVELQNAGKFADALDKFQRAQGVVNAPTNLLHIAECQAATNKLVEAAETYRDVIQFTLPPNPPQPFVAAQSQASGELSQLNPRIPEVTIDVTPAKLPVPLEVQIDGQTMPDALVGAARPFNPGIHKIVVRAAGYGAEERTIDVKEKSRQRVAIELKTNGVVSWGDAATSTGLPPPTGGSQTSVVVPPSQLAPPPPYMQPPESAAPAYRSRMSLLLGVRLGGAVPAGDVPFSNGQYGGASDYSGAGLGYGIEAKFRFLRVFYVGGLLQGESYGAGDRSVPTGAKRSSSGTLGLLTAGWISNPDGFGVILNLGVGHRWYSLDDPTPTAGSYVMTESKSGATDFQVGAGLFIRTGRIFRLIPKVEVDFSSLESTDSTVSAPATGKARFVFVGLGGDFDINFDKGPSASKSDSTK